MSMSRSTISSVLTATLMAVVGCRGSAPDDLIVGEQTTEMLVFVKASAEETLNRTRSSSNLYVLAPISPDGEVRPLTAFTNASVYDPCVSFDGTKVLFSMAPEPGARRNIWEIGVDGTGLHKISGVDANGKEGDDFDPLYLPDGRIAFTSNRPGHLDEYNRSLAEALHVMNADGSGIEQISFNMSDDFDPFLLANGRIAYTRWDHHGTQNRFPLFATNPDGSGTFHLFGPHNRNFFHSSLVPDGRIVSIVSTEVNGDHGQIMLSRLEATHGDPLQPGQLESLTPDIELGGPPFLRGAYKYARWIGENRFVVSYTLPFGEEGMGEEEMVDENEADYGLYTFEVIADGKGGEKISQLTFLYNDPQTQEYDAQLVAPRERPEVIESALDPQASTGVFHVSTVFNRQNGDGQERPQPGDVHEVMVIEAIPTMRGDSREISSTEFERKRIIGRAPIEDDGSFHIRVPANTPISFNVLDDLGRSMVTKRNWIYARPGEEFLSCTGCHGPRGSSANLNTLALAREPTDLDVPVAQREVINFSETLQVVVESKCTSCHQPTFETVWQDSIAVVDTIAPAGDLDLRMVAVTDTMRMTTFPLAYLSLAGGMENMMGSRVTTPGFSRRSRLIDVILGVGSAAGQPPHPQGAEALSAEERRWFTNWVDLGAQYR
ncbi:MAG: PD40 domain-containing protein [Candidatus Latescibacterota bacterium]|nr:MAG: PD40 domain-containing protein [Candidatus Latescibacterota bacterium]